MTKTLLLSTLLTALCLAPACSSDDDATGAAAAPDLRGRWASATCEAYPGQDGQTSYLTRDFTMTEARWSLALTVYADAACATALFDAAIEGPYTVGGASAVVAGASEAEFAVDTNRFTARVDAMAATFDQAGCGAGGWKVGEPQDVTATGCIGVAHQKAECPREYDLVKVDGDSLYLGQRVADLCAPERRPTALAPFAVVRR